MTALAWLRTGLVVAALGSIGALAQSDAGGAAAPPQALPFVGPSGLLFGTLNYSAVVARLGEPPASQTGQQRGQQTGQTRPGNATDSSDWIFAYPALGLSFRVAGNERTRKDPAIESFGVRAPWVQTEPNAILRSMDATARAGGPPPPPLWAVEHQEQPRAGGVGRPGLRIGMSRDELNGVLAQHYRVVHDDRQGHSRLVLGDPKSRGKRTVAVVLRDERVASIEFMAHDPPAAWRGWLHKLATALKSLLSLAALVAIAIALTWLHQRVREARGRASGPAPARDDDRGGQPILHGLAVVLLVGGLLVAFWAWSHVGGGGWGALGMLIIALGGAAAAFMSMFLFAGSRITVVRWFAYGVIGLAMLGMIAEKFVR